VCLPHNTVILHAPLPSCILCLCTLTLYTFVVPLHASPTSSEDCASSPGCISIFALPLHALYLWRCLAPGRAPEGGGRLLPLETPLPTTHAAHLALGASHTSTLGLVSCLPSVRSACCASLAASAINCCTLADVSGLLDVLPTTGRAWLVVWTRMRAGGRTWIDSGPDNA